MCAQGITTCGGSAKVAYKEALGEYVVFPFSKVTKKPHQLVDCSKGKVMIMAFRVGLVIMCGQWQTIHME